MSDVAATLEKRHARYGKFMDNSQFAQQMKTAMRAQPSWNMLESDQQEALDQVASKIGRILTGDPNYTDSWHDLAGYPTLIEKRLNGEPL